jgi:hypothetical protein
LIYRMTVNAIYLKKPKNNSKRPYLPEIVVSVKYPWGNILF